MKLEPCACRIPLPFLGDRSFCAHPRVHLVDGLLVNNVCHDCGYRTTDTQVNLRPLPRQLQPSETIPACFFRGHPVGTLHGEFRCHHPAKHTATLESCRTCPDYSLMPQKGSVRKWAVGVTTAPRDCRTLARTLESLNSTGWQSKEIHLFAEPNALEGDENFQGTITVRGRRAGAFPNWFLALQELVLTQPSADAYLLCQDDIVCCAGLRQSLQHSLWPESATGFVSLYCGMLQPRRENCQGFVKLQPGETLYGALAVAFPAASARALLLHPIFQRHRASQNGLYGIDTVLGQWSIESGLPGFVHVPSLVDHIGHTSAIFSTIRDGPERRCDNFVGQETAADSVLK